MKKGFTLIEILVVVLIIVVLAVTVLLILNPITLTEQAYDATRISDMSSLNKAVSLYYSDAMNSPSTMFMGSSSIIYISIPDPAATTTAGTNCAAMGLPPLPSGDVYHCAASSTYLRVDGTGWLPINFTSYLSGKAGSVISKLPVDPVNQTSSGLYYTYATQNEGYELTSLQESQKGIAEETASGNVDPAMYAVGTDLTISPFAHGLVGYWTFADGSGTSAADSSGFGNTGTLNGGPSWTTGKFGGALQFVAADSENVSVPDVPSLEMTNSWTLSAWVDLNSLPASGSWYDFIKKDTVAGNKDSYELDVENYSGTYVFETGFDLNPSGAAFAYSASTISTHTWYFVAGTWNTSNHTLSLYVNGALKGTLNTGSSVPTSNNGYPLYLSGDYYPLDGTMEDVRVYDRALSAAEIANLYADP